MPNRPATRNGRPAHELFAGRTLAAVPMREWTKRHAPMSKPGWLRRLFERIGK